MRLATSFLTQPKELRRLFLFVAGAFAGLGQAPYDLPFATVLAFGFVLALQAQGGTVRAALGRGWAFGAGYFALTLHWIVQPFLVEPEVYGWMAPFALVLMAGGLGMFWAGAFVAASWLRPQGAVAMLALALVWLAEEVFRSYAFTGFPWVLPGHIWIDTPLLGLAAYLGPHGLGAVTLMFALCVPLFLSAGPARFIGGAGLAAALLASVLPQQHNVSRDIAGRPLVRIVQPNAPQEQKFDPDFIPVFQRRLLLATGAEPAPDLVVWPETSVPYLLEWANDTFDIASDLSRGAPVVMGINRRVGERYYNALAVIGQGGQILAIYDKEHLAPFGEYMPFGEVFARFGIHGIAASEGGGFSAGAPRPLINLPGIGLARPLICYEASFANEIIQNDARPDVLLLITNDAWFGLDAGPYQHLAHARLRAAEQGLPVIRAANTGVSVMIDGTGIVTAGLALGQTGHLDASLPLPLPPTLYSRTGDWPVIWALLLGIGLLLARRKIAVDLAMAGQ